jgi:HD-like signal output (HDOD) protein
MIKRPARAPKHRVLIIEKIGFSSNVIRKVLTEPEFGVKTLSTPELGRKEIGLNRPDIVFVNILNKPKTTFPFCREVAESGIPVIALGAKPTRASVIQAARNGCMGYVITPPEESALRKRVNSVLVSQGKAKPFDEKAIKLEFPAHIRKPRNRIDYVIRKAKDLLALPHAVSTVLQLSNSPDSSAGDLVQPVESDTALTAAVFRLVNSAAMTAAHRQTDLRNAIARLGMKATANLAMAQSVFKMFERKSDTFGFDRTQYWLHALGTACCGRVFSEYCGECDGDDAFLTGLLHDLGKMLMDEYIQSEYQIAVKTSNLNGQPVRQGEKKIFEVDHSYAGSDVARQWELPDLLCGAIADHHKAEKLLMQPENEKAEEKTSRTLIRCTALANHLAKAFCFGHAGDFMVAPSELPLWNVPAGQDIDLRNVFEKVRDELQQYIDLLHIEASGLHLNLAENRDETVLLVLPEDGRGWRMLLEAFFVRHGYCVQTASSLETAGSGPYKAAVMLEESGISGAARAAAAELLQKTERAAVFCREEEVVREKGIIEDRLHLLPPIPDFHALTLFMEAGNDARAETGQDTKKTES